MKFLKTRKNILLVFVTCTTLLLSGCDNNIEIPSDAVTYSQTVKSEIINTKSISKTVVSTISTEQTVQETQQTTETTTGQTEQTVENVESSETESPAKSGDNATETVVIAGQEFSVDETVVGIYIDNGMEFVTDISELSKLKNLKWLIFTNISDGGPYSIDGLKALEGSESLEYIDLGVGLANEEDIHILETMPNLKSLSLYGTYTDFEFNIPSLEHLYLLGTYDLSKIEHLTELVDLSLVYNNGDDLSPVAKLKNLRRLKIEECFFEDYSSILELENLENLWICSRPMTEEMYNKICEKFPDCNITVM